MNKTESKSDVTAEQRVSQFKLFSSSLLAVLVKVIVLLVLFFISMKSFKKNFLIEKSVMKPEIIESFDRMASGVIKMYPANEGGKDDYISVFESNILRYGIEMKSHRFTHNGIEGENRYSVIKSRKENNFRYYLLSFDKRNRYEMVAVNLFLTEFFNRNTNLGISIILLAYDSKFKQYSIAVEEFFKALFSKEEVVRDCNFIRDGLNIEIASSKAPSSALFYYPCKLTRRKGRHHLRLRVPYQLPRKLQEQYVL